MKNPKILAINPWIYDFAAHDLWGKPMGLLYILGFLRERGLNVDFIDCLDRHNPALLQLQGREAPHVRKYGIGPYHREVIPTPELIAYVPRRFSRYGLPEDIFRDELTKCPRPDAILITSVMTYWYMGIERC